MTKKPSLQRVTTPPVPDPDAPFLLRLSERLTYLRNRRWVQLSLLALLIALAVWGFFYVRSRLPKTPAQTLAIRTDSLQTSLRVQDAANRLELVRAMINAGRDPANVERYRNLIDEDLKATFGRAPREIRNQWGELESIFNQLQAELSSGSEETLVTLGELEAKLKTFNPASP
jgi:hypothetical protein